MAGELYRYQRSENTHVSIGPPSLGDELGYIARSIAEPISELASHMPDLGINQKATKAMFNALDAYRRINPSGTPLLNCPWEISYLKSNGADKWNKQLAQEAPSSYEMARDWLASSLFPIPLLKQMEKIDTDPNERHIIRKFQTEMTNWAEEYLQHLPSRMAGETASMLAYSLTGGAIPQAIPIITALGGLSAINNSGSQSKMYSWANLTRRMGEIMDDFTDYFFDDRKKYLAHYQMSEKPEVFIQKNISISLAKIEALEAWIRLAGSIPGVAVGLPLNAALFHRDINGLLNLALLAGTAVVSKATEKTVKETLRIFYKTVSEFNVANNRFVKALYRRDRNLGQHLDETLQANSNVAQVLEPRNQLVNTLANLTPFAAIGLASMVDINAASYTTVIQLLVKNAFDLGIAMSSLNDLEVAQNGNLESIAHAMNLIEQGVQAQALTRTIGRDGKDITLDKLVLLTGEKLDLTGVKFKPGFNFIQSTSGGGKSTLLDLIADYVKEHEGRGALAFSKAGQESADLWGAELVSRLAAGKAEGLRMFLLGRIKELGASEQKISLGIPDKYYQTTIQFIERALNDPQLMPQLLEMWNKTFAQRTENPYSTILNQMTLEYLREFIDGARLDMLYAEIATGVGASFGETNRLALASALMDTGVNTQVMLVDESLSNVDAATRKRMISKLMELARQRPDLIIIMVDHDLDFALRNALSNRANYPHYATNLDLTSRRFREIPHFKSTLEQSIKIRGQYSIPEMMTSELLHERVGELLNVNNLANPGDLDQNILELTKQLYSPSLIEQFFIRGRETKGKRNAIEKRRHDLNGEIYRIFEFLIKHDVSWHTFFSEEFSINPEDELSVVDTMRKIEIILNFNGLFRELGMAQVESRRAELLQSPLAKIVGSHTYNTFLRKLGEVNKSWIDDEDRWLFNSHSFRGGAFIIAQHPKNKVLERIVHDDQLFIRLALSLGLNRLHHAINERAFIGGNAPFAYRLASDPDFYIILRSQLELAKKDQSRAPFLLKFILRSFEIDQDVMGSDYGKRAEALQELKALVSRITDPVIIQQLRACIDDTDVTGLLKHPAEIFMMEQIIEEERNTTIQAIQSIVDSINRISAI